MFKIRSRKFIITFIVVIGLVVLHYLQILQPVEDLFLRSTQPVAEKVYGMGALTKNVYEGQFEKRNRSQTIEELRDRVNKLTAENAKLKALKEENRKLREYLDFWEKSEYENVMANVVSQEVSGNPQQKGDNIVIDKGRKDGIRSGLIVANKEGIVVGKTEKVRSHSSQVTLITDNEFRIAASIQNNDRTNGVVKGKMGLTMGMDFIPQSEKIEVDNTVVTSGLEKNVPRGFVLGKVVEVKDDSNSVWQQAVIEPMVEFDELTIVSVVAPSL